jgi:4-amino-4-deoxy-L-arabinose transferase-like glycosyltransferase
MQKNNKLFNTFFRICIFLFALSIRLYHIDSLPVNHDEAKYARILLERGETVLKFIRINTRFFYPFQFPPFLIAHLPAFRIYSLNKYIFYLRLPAAVIGAVTVFLTYILAKRMYGQKEAALASLLLCFLPWHILQSRIMLPAIWIPFFGCLIFLCFFNSIREENIILKAAWFLLSCVLLKVSLVYESGLLFIPIFLVTLLYLNKKIKFKIIATAIALLFISPVIYTIVKWGNQFWGSFYRTYHQNIFEGNLLLNIAKNFKNNFGFAIRQLFFNFKYSTLLYGKTLKSPLLIHPIVFIIFLLSLVTACWRRKAADKILLTWLSLGFFPAIVGIDFFQPHYILIILPPLVILIGRFIADILNNTIFINRVIKKEFLLIIGTLIFGFLLQAEIIQWTNFYNLAPFDLDECRNNSFGSKEAAEYLQQLPDIEKYYIILDVRMPVDFYFSYFLLSSGKSNFYNISEQRKKSWEYWNRRFYVDIISVVTEKIKAGGIDKLRAGRYNIYPSYTYIRGLEASKKIFLLWAPESHPVNYWNGEFRHRYDTFKKVYPHEKLTKTIYYPNGLPAIYIFEIE